MQYILIKTKPQGLPMTKNEVYVMPTVIFTGIVGQTYSGFQSVDLDYCPILDTDNSIQIQTKMDEFGAAYVAKKYPNI